MLYAIGKIVGGALRPDWFEAMNFIFHRRKRRERRISSAFALLPLLPSVQILRSC